MTASATPDRDAEFARRFAGWQANHLHYGPARSYPHAWRLPELARPLGRLAVARAAYALGLTLHDMGRFREALACLADADALPTGERVRVLGLQARCLTLLGMDDVANLQAWRIDSSPEAQRQRGYLAFLRDDPAMLLALFPSGLAEADQAAWSTVLRYWAAARLGRTGEVAALHAALRDLRLRAPTLAAHAEAIHAEAAYHAGPAWSVSWLDVALELCESHGQHHIKPRLLLLKAKALAAAGQLGDCGRFLKLARELALRQGASLYVREMAG